jgi:prepilin-type N-terminal cleavage/methylation domain-containing protein
MKIKLQVAGCRLQVFENLRHRSVSTFNLQPSTFNRCAAFTLIEIALCLAVIGIALVAIIGVLPLGMDVQRENREATVVNQDATIFMEAIRNGARGADDLTNYVYEIQVGTNQPIFAPFTSGAQIIGLLTTPNNLTNHAYVRSISGSAVEKPPQANATVLGDSFSYRIICENIPVQTTDNSYYGRQLTNSLHELRLTFLWPQLPGGTLPARPARQTFRSLVAGQVVQDANNPSLYFFQSQSFTHAP